MSTQTHRMIRHAPPLWMTLTAAAIVAASLLGGFITVLHDHLRHSAEVRRTFAQPAPHAGSVRHIVATAAAAGPALPAAPLR